MNEVSVFCALQFDSVGLKTITDFSSLPNTPRSA